jgi:hypothetical protein
MPDTSPIVRGYALHAEQDAIVRDYARRKCGGNTSLAARTIISHFANCPEAINAEPAIVDALSDDKPEPAR